jgi:succinate dehydrogenase iron-sulfur subunit
LFSSFVGPRLLVYAAALEMHPLDVEKRAVDLKHEHGVGFCNITKCCTKVCPEGITITDNAIIPLKERVIDQLYDPVAKLFRMLRPTSHKAPAVAPLSSPKASPGVSVSSSEG